MTPLYNVLHEYAQKEPARFHMPGHKGRFLPIPELMGAAALDVTEISSTGNLYQRGEPFDTAQHLWAQRFGFDYCQFLTGGSTMGIHTALSLCCRPGDSVLVDRNCHRAVFNADDAITVAIADKVKAKTYFFSTRRKCRGAYVDGADIVFDGGDGAKRVCGLDCVKLVGEHNLSDCLAAVAACKLYGARDEAIARGLATFNAPKYRLEHICDFRGTAIYNDSKSTNIDCTISACEAMRGTTCLIVGGYDKRLSYHNFFSRLPDGVKYVVCCGDNSSSIIECATESNDRKICRTATLERAVMLGLSFGADNLLFSPSTSSYDAYRNFEERGRHFEQTVRTFCA